MINNMVPSVVRQIPSLPKTYFVRDIISYGYFGDVTRSRGTPFDEESEQGREYDAAIKKKTLKILHYLYNENPARFGRKGSSQAV